ncbi:hypothetical protein ES705_23132 [subsurface metagenome]
MDHLPGAAIAVLIALTVYLGFFFMWRGCGFRNPFNGKPFI